MIKLSWGLAAQVAIILYITLGAGHEIYYGFVHHKVQASLPFISLSAAIFLSRIGYAVESKATKTIIADSYGALTMCILLLLKLWYE